MSGAELPENIGEFAAAARCDARAIMTMKKLYIVALQNAAKQG